MRPFTPRPQNQAMQFNPQQQPQQPQQQHQGFNQNPQFPNPQMPNFNTATPFFQNGPPAQMGQQQMAQNMFAAAAMQLVQQQSNPQFAPANQMQNNNNLAAALVQMAGLISGQNVNQGMQNQIGGGFQCPQMPQQQQFAGPPQGFLQNPIMGGNQGLPLQAPRSGSQQPTNSMNQQWTNTGQGQFAVPTSNGQSGMQQNAMVVQNSQPMASSFPGANQPRMNMLMNNPMVVQNSQPLASSFPIRANQPRMNMQMNNPMGVQNSQPLAPIFPPGGIRPRMSMPMNNLLRPQVNQVPDRCHVEFQVDGKGVPSNMRVLNQGSSVNITKRNMGPSARNGAQGCSRQKNKDRPDVSEEPKQQFPTFKYTEQEVAQWREARKKNYPTKAKKLGKGGKFARGRRNRDDYEDLKLRRQQLKEILAKQSELGVEVAELPYYLTETKERKGKKAKREAQASTSKGISVKRKPTLLQKLLAPEKMRDKSRLLQIFRFMALNNFFEEPDKELKFPVVKLEGVDNDSDSEDEDEEDNTGKECEEEKDASDEEGLEHLSAGKTQRRSRTK